MSLFCYRCNTTDKDEGIAHEPNVATLIVLSFLAQSNLYSINTKTDPSDKDHMAAMLDDKKNT